MRRDFQSMPVKEKVQYICVFLPILCTIGWIVYELGGNNISFFMELVSNVLMVVGLISALVCIVLTDLVGFVKFLFSSVVKGWTLGMAVFPIFPFCFITAFIGFAAAIMFLMILCTAFPVALTIYFYNKTI